MGSMALQLKPFTVPDPLETYGRAMSLRALMDERRYRALREQQAQQKILEDQEERQQTQNLRQLFSTNPNPTMQQIMSVAPSNAGLRAATELRQAQSAEEQQKTAALTREKTFRDVQQGFREEYLNAVTAIARDKDPARRAAIYPEIQQRLRQAAGDYLTSDLDAFISQELPDDEDEILTVYAAVKGPEALEKLLKDRATETRAKAEEARKGVEFAQKAAGELRAQQTHVAELPGRQARALGEQYELASRFTPNVRDQATYDQLLTMLPEEERKKWPAMYSPGAVQMIANTGMTAAQRATAERQAIPNTVTELQFMATDPNATPEQRQHASAALQRHTQDIVAARPPRAMVGDLTPGQLNLTQSLARQFDNTPVVKKYNEIADKQQTMAAILSKPALGGPGDLAFVYEFMKALDPTSVVRETEYANAAKSGNIFAGAWAKYNGYLKPEGGFLPPQVKESFMQLVNQKLGVSRGHVQNLYKDYGRRIEKITGQPDGTSWLTHYPGLIEEETPTQKAPTGGASQPKPTHRFNPATGKVEAVTR